MVASRTAAAGIGTTLDEGTTCADLTRAAVAQAGGAAAVLRAGRAAGPEYAAVSGNPDLQPEARQAEAAAREYGDPGESRPVARATRGTRTVLSVPLATGGHAYGTLVCVRAEAPFTRAEADLLVSLAERAASHIRHAREHNAVSSIIGTMQRALLAEPGRPHPNVDVAIRYLPVGESALAATGARPSGCTSAAPCWSSATSWGTAWRPPST
ncbi:GAF domain-containing protein [Streptomyces sp. NPDC046727]|uniref:GAF domain-containing protein n=1 Tax=Streptomyces sp. NPDC046727 TaxID=3155373 RepID=UPI0033ED9926